MGIGTWLAFVALTGGSIRAEAQGKAAQPVVLVCMTSSEPGVLQAHSIASKMFDEIGITIRWLGEAKACRLESGPVIEIQVTKSQATRHDAGPLARAWEYEGTRIEVFYEQVRKRIGPPRLPLLLGHVLAHEIAHILQGIDIHTESGVMKAQWDQRDFDRMAWKPFSFTDRDAKLILMGLAKRGAPSH